MKDQNKKVAIVGGGICGLYLATKLSKMGHNVTVFEKNGKIGKESCSGLFSNRILNFIPESGGLVENKISHVLIRFPKKTLKVIFSKEFLVMSHDKLDNLVFKMAKEAGAKLKLREKIVEIPKGFDIVIGCDGFSSIIRKKIKLKDPEFKIGIQYFNQEKNNDNWVDVWPQKDKGFIWKKNSSFIWKIPRGEEVEYGVLGSLKESKNNLQKFLNNNKIKREGKEFKLISAIVPFGLRIPSNSSITLCGDSMGLTKPWSGGGVVWGLIAADILLKNFPNIKKYHKEVKKFFMIKIFISKVLVKFVYFFGFNIPIVFPKKLKVESDFLF